MGYSRLSIFVFYYCLSIIYLVNWSLSFSLNYDKEKAKLRGLIPANITDPIEREDKLLQIAIEDREEQVQRERELGQKHADRAAKLEEQKEIAEGFARQLMSPSKIRFAIEHLQDLNLPSPKTVLTRMGTILSTLDGLVEKMEQSVTEAVKYIPSYVKLISKHVREQKNVEDSATTATTVKDTAKGKNVQKNGKKELEPKEVLSAKWSNLKTAVASLVEDGHICETIDSDREDYPVLWVALKFACTETIDEGEKLIYSLREESFWAKSQKFSILMEKRVKLLAYEEVIYRTQTHKGMEFKKETEVTYALDYLRMQKDFAEGVGSEIENMKFQKECLSVLYFSTSPKVFDLRKKLDGHYPQQPCYARRYHFCREESLLYNVVSNTYEHTAGLHPPSEKCLPEAVDMKKFIQSLIVDYNSTEYAFVASVLTGLDIPFPKQLCKNTISAKPEE